MDENNPAPPSKAPPAITLPQRTSIHNLFSGGPGASPGPMSLVSSFFTGDDPDIDCQSFSQLLASTMSPRGAVPNVRQSFAPPESVGGDFRFQQQRPAGLVVSQSPGVFAVSPGLSPACLLQSPVLFSSSQGPMSHQQILAQVTGQGRAQKQMQSEYASLTGAPASSVSPLPPLHSNASLHSQMPPSFQDQKLDIRPSDQKSQPLNFPVDKPTDDGYNWRKYGQKQVKGSEFPRSYYKCTNANCPVKKKVERSLEGQITEIIYKGQHNHPAPIRRAKDTGNTNGTVSQGKFEFEGQAGNLSEPKEGTSHLSSTKDLESGQVTSEHISGSSDSEEVGNVETRIGGREEDEPESKRRNIEVQTSEQAPNHRTVTEPRIIVQTTSEIDLLDDGYRWRKYGQKVVKGNPHPRSYYKCTYTGCNVRKHIERAASDPKAVITTYEGKHNHDVPAAKNSSHSTVSSQLRPQVARPAANVRMEFMKNEQQSVAPLQFKEEQNITFF